MYFAIYQAIAKDQRRPGLYRDFPKDFCDVIVARTVCWTVCAGYTGRITCAICMMRIPKSSWAVGCTRTWPLTKTRI